MGFYVQEHKPAGVTAGGTLMKDQALSRVSFDPLTMNHQARPPTPERLVEMMDTQEGGWCNLFIIKYTQYVANYCMQLFMLLWNYKVSSV